MQDAINKVVRSVPGGEHLFNAKFYAVLKYNFKGQLKSRNYIATGDVWGINHGNAGIKGFHKGDKVVFKYTRNLKKRIKENFKGEINKQYKGKVISLHGASATIQLKNSTVLKIPYSALTNLGK